MTRNLPLSALLAALLLALASPSRAEESLRYAPKAGETFGYVVKADVEMTSPGFSLKVHSRIVYEFTVEDDAEPFSLQGKIRREETKIDMNLGMLGEIKGTVDTAKERPPAPENPMDFRGLIPYGLHVKSTARIGRPFTVVVDAQGEIRKIRGVESILDRVREAVEGDETISPMMRPGLLQDVTAPGFERGVRAVFVPLPAEPVAPGASWSREFERTLDDKSVLRLRESVTFREMQDGMAALSLAVRPREEGQELQPQSSNPMMRILSAKVESYKEDTEALVDPATGRVFLSVGGMEFVQVQTTENPMTREKGEQKVKMITQAEVEYVPGGFEEGEEE